MTPTEQQIHALLERRQAIDRMPEGSFTANQRWLIDAVEFLLQHQLKYHEASRRILTDAGILR
jgi:hypothetical protein